ncbi:MAG: hypothetical protein WBW73_24260, partial [Rhodoplanes sp.]
QRRLHLGEHDGDALVERGNRGGDGLGPLDHLEREGQPLLRQLGMRRWVGLGVIADNILNIGRATKKRSTP